MYVDINEPVEVIAHFSFNKLVPKKLKWGSRVYDIEKVNMVHHSYQGRALIYYFSVSDKSNFFRLAFNTDNLRWNLEQVYHEG